MSKNDLTIIASEMSGTAIMTNEKFEDPFVDLDEDKPTMDKDQHVINLVIMSHSSFSVVFIIKYSISDYHLIQ